MNPGELESLIALVRSACNHNPQVMVEFGCHDGRTAKAILREIKSINQYVGVDVPLTYLPSKVVQRKEVPSDPGCVVRDEPRFNLIVRPNGSIDLAASELPSADVVFIDGDHGRKAVKHDTQLARSVVRSGGLIIWHDYHDLRDAKNIPLVDVREVLHECAMQGAPIFHVEGTWLAFERIS